MNGFSKISPTDFPITCTRGYRFAFNGQEKVDEISGAGNHNTAEFWEYDTRLGRRWNLDPVTFPWQSTYATFNNTPILFSDPLGLYGSEKKAERKRKKAEKAGWVTSPTHNTNGEWTFQVSDPVDFNNTRLVWDENKFDMSPYAQQHGAISEFKPDFYDKWGASKNFFGKLSYSIFDDTCYGWFRYSVFVPSKGGNWRVGNCG